MINEPRYAFTSLAKRVSLLLFQPCNLCACVAALGLRCAALLCAALHKPRNKKNNKTPAEIRNYLFYVQYEWKTTHTHTPTRNGNKFTHNEHLVWLRELRAITEQKGRGNSCLLAWCVYYVSASDASLRQLSARYVRT